MALMWGQVKTWSSDSLSTYVGTVGSRRDTVLKQVNALRQSMSSFQGEGQTADALRKKMTDAQEELEVLADDLAEVQDAVVAAERNVSEVESAVKNALSAASLNGCGISDDGSVSCHIPHGTDGTGAIQAAIEKIEVLVLEALSLADYADSTFQAQLASAGTEKSTSSMPEKGARPWSKEEQEKFRNMSPEERAKFWSEQTYEQKQYVCDRYPQLIGNADGVEAWARDRANRINLREEKAKTEKLIRNLEISVRNSAQYTYPGGAYGNDIYQRNKDLNDRLDRARRDLEAFNKIESALANGISLEDYQHGTKGDPVSLLTLQNDGRRVKAAVAQGDVDHASNIATFVPGIATTVEGSLEDYVRQTKNLREAAAAQGNISTKDVATIAWLGYDAPGGFSPGNLPDIVSPTLAQAGSDRLAGFLTGMQASREYGAGDAHMTLVGHSYGSTTSGMAATKVKPGVIDDLVLFGSPGMGTFDPSELNVNEGHRWVSGLPVGDSVQGLGGLVTNKIETFGLGKNPMDANSTFTHLSDDATGYEKYKPNAMTSDPHEYLKKLGGWFLRRPFLPLPLQMLDPMPIPSFVNHNFYLEQGTETLQDIARVVAGTKK